MLVWSARYFSYPMAAPLDPASYGPRAGLLVPLPLAERGVSVITSASPDGSLLIYANGSNVIVRDLANPALAMVYAEHTAVVKAAKFSPSGKFVASGGASPPRASSPPTHFLPHSNFHACPPSPPAPARRHGQGARVGLEPPRAPA